MGCSNDTPEASQPDAQVASEPSPTPDPVSPAGEKLIADAIVEKAVRKSLKKPDGKLTESDLEKIDYLSWRLTKITDKGLKDVAKLQNLTHLNVSGSKITDAGLKEAAKLQKLKYLWLDDTKVTDEGVAKLKKALPNCRTVGP